MAISFPPQMHISKRTRRTATSVMAGAFDPRPSRDVLTSLLNGVGPYKVVEGDEELRKAKRKEKREREKARKRELDALRAQEKLELESQANEISGTSYDSGKARLITSPLHQPTAASYWGLRPSIHMTMAQRSVSVTPPPSTSPILFPSTPASTPGPCDSSSTSRTSSKRPRTPDDFEDIEIQVVSSPRRRPPRKRRPAVRKGWKGWVEGSPPPSEKLINLDSVPILQERRTRSGKNFDAIGVGKDSWV